jgi:diguanylate cyclase (GGDEF)-like protein/PAS domain S-box-containing protein
MPITVTGAATAALGRTEIHTMDVRGDSQIEPRVERDSRETLYDTAALMECQEKLDFHTSLLDAISEGVLAHTLDGRIIYVNEAACEIYGYCRSEFENLEPWAWVTSTDHDSIPARVAEIRKPGGTAFAGFGPTRDDGSPMHTQIHAQTCNTFRHGEIIVSVVHDTTERVIAEERIRHMALHDSLTGLPNRGLLQERMQQALASADRHGDVVGVVYADLDDFKPVNDTLGHAMGDEVLKIVSARLKSCMRESDTVARVGGDEFVALFPRLESANDLANIASSISGCIDVPIQVDGHQVTITASVGLAIYAEGEATDELINRADHAMYHAKQDGLSGWEEFRAARLATHR